jgi:hypothetical protein
MITEKEYCRITGRSGLPDNLPRINITEIQLFLIKYMYIKHLQQFIGLFLNIVK